MADFTMNAPEPLYRRWLSVLSVLLVLATFGIVALGGAVTSFNAGMAVPDGFTTFGTWSLIAPLRTWAYEAGTFLEHSHRLKGYVVGFLALGFFFGVVLSGARRRLGLVALAAVILVFVIAQAVLGIVRVDHNSLLIAGIHGVTGQVFLGLTIVAAAAVGRYWIERRRNAAHERPARGPATARWLTRGLIAALLLQLTLGSAVRHSHSALAIPDWPLHYGQVMPPMSPAELTTAVAAYPAEKLPANYGHLSVGGVYEPWQVHLHFTHRLMGYAVFVLGLAVAGLVIRRYQSGGRDAVWAPAAAVAVLMVVQVLLGVMTVLSGEGAAYATLHQTCGATLLAAAVWLAVRVTLTPAEPVSTLRVARDPAAASPPSGAQPA